MESGSAMEGGIVKQQKPIVNSETAKQLPGKVKLTPEEEALVLRLRENRKQRAVAPKFRTIDDEPGFAPFSPNKSKELWEASLLEACGSSDVHFQCLLMMELSSLWMARTDKENRLNASLAAMAGLAPQNELEGMLCSEMVVCHMMAMERLYGVNVDGQTPDGADKRINQANKLMRTYLMQVEALQRLRGKTTQQKVIVEHVNVEAGGQAIVGAVSQIGRGGRGSIENNGEGPHAKRREATKR